MKTRILTAIAIILTLLALTIQAAIALPGYWYTVSVIAGWTDSDGYTNPSGLFRWTAWGVLDGKCGGVPPVQIMDTATQEVEVASSICSSGGAIAWSIASAHNGGWNNPWWPHLLPYLGNVTFSVQVIRSDGAVLYAGQNVLYNTSHVSAHGIAGA